MVLVASVLCAAYITHCANTGGLGWVSWVGCQSTPASRGWGAGRLLRDRLRGSCRTSTGRGHVVVGLGDGVW